jgi:hypothetical protein
MHQMSLTVILDAKLVWHRPENQQWVICAAPEPEYGPICSSSIQSYHQQTTPQSFKQQMSLTVILDFKLAVSLQFMHLVSRVDDAPLFQKDIVDNLVG